MDLFYVAVLLCEGVQWFTLHYPLSSLHTASMEPCVGALCGRLAQALTKPQQYPAIVGPLLTSLIMEQHRRIAAAGRFPIMPLLIRLAPQTSILIEMLIPFDHTGWGPDL